MAALGVFYGRAGQVAVRSAALGRLRFSAKLALAPVVFRLNKAAKSLISVGCDRRFALKSVPRQILSATHAGSV